MANALKRRGSLTIWFDPGMIWAAKPTGKRGRQPVYSDAAVQTCLTMKVLFGMVDIGAPLVQATMATRQTTGFVESLLSLIGLDWDVPDFSTLSRRQKTLAVNIRHRAAQGPLHLLIDSTGIKVEGEGEWTEEGQQTVRGTVCPTKAQAWRGKTPRLAQGPSRDRRTNVGDQGGRSHQQRNRRRRAGKRHRFKRTGEACCLSCSTRSQPIRRSPASPPTEPTTRANVTIPSPNEGLMP
jgi:hypothetical protein